MERPCLSEAQVISVAGPPPANEATGLGGDELMGPRDWFEAGMDCLGREKIQARSIGQIKAARALLGWSQEQLAAVSGVSIPTVKRLEAADGPLD